MIKQKGTTLIELMIMFVFLAAFGMIVATGIAGLSGSGGNISFGINGMTESRCIEGYKFVIGEQGTPRQILDEFGKGVKCENPNAGKPGAFGRM